ncbi:protein of unknown function [Pararobbsia alpina]
MTKRPMPPPLPKGPALTPEQNRQLLAFFKEQARLTIEESKAPLMRQVAVRSPSGGHMLVTVPVDEGRHGSQPVAKDGK